MCRTAQSPRNGIEPWAMRPKVSSSAHQTPRWPRQTRSLFRGSGMMTWSTRAKWPCRREVGDAAVAAGLLVGGGGDLDRAGKVGAERRKASTATIAAARPPFMSQVPRP